MLCSAAAGRGWEPSGRTEAVSSVAEHWLDTFLTFTQELIYTLRKVDGGKDRMVLIF